MSEKIDGYTPKQWCNDPNAVLVIESDGEVTARFKNHIEYGEPAWPPLEANGDRWYIEDQGGGGDAE